MSFDEQPDAPVHGECAAEIRRLEGKVSRALGEKHWFRHELRGAKNRIAELESIAFSNDGADGEAMKAHLERVDLRAKVAALENTAAGLGDIVNEKSATIKEQAALIEKCEIALTFYGDESHFTKHNECAWDTVSGEPQNLWEDDANTATVEDGTFARQALAAIAAHKNGGAA